MPYEIIEEADGRIYKIPECYCGDQETVEERFSLGIYAGLYCDDCWKRSGYRDEGPEGYDFLDAGEYYGPEDY